jgi:hypothetical protein
MNKNINTNISTVSKFLFGTAEECQALLCINQERKYSEVLDQNLGIQLHTFDNKFSYLTNNLLSVLKAIPDKQHINPRFIERIKTKILTIENHYEASMVRIEKKCYTITVKDFLT